MNKSKKLTAAVAVSAVASALVAPAAYADNHLTDIDGSYAKDAIMELVEKGILNGKGDGMFDPAGKIERQDFAIILAKALMLDVSSAPATATFSDVPTTHYAYKYVEAAAKAGLIKGTGEGQFGLGANLSRQDMAVLFVRALGEDVTGKGASLKFSDAGEIADYAKDAVAAAVEWGLVSGNPDGTFNPAGNAERQAVALVASKFLKVAETKATAQLTGATAVDSSTVTLTFSKEATEVKAADVAVAAKATGAAVTVSSVTLSADKKSATVKLSTALAAGTTYTVAFGGKTVEFSTAAKTEVTAVSALNLKQVKVEFSGKVDETLAETVTNFTLTGTGGLVLDATAGDVAELQEDGKTVLITLGGTRQLTQQGSYSLKVANQKDSVSVDVAEATKTFTSFDNAVPTAKEVTVVGPNTLKVTFSAPLVTTTPNGSFSLDNGSVSATPSAAAISGTEYSVTLNVGATLAEGEHTVKLSGQAGYNGLKTTEQTLTFNYAKDTVAPTVSVASVKLYDAGSNSINSKVVFQFSEPVALNGATFYAVYNKVLQYASTNVVAATGAKTFVSNGVTYTDAFEVTFGQVFPTGTINFFVNNASETVAASMVKDAWGNAFTTATVSATHSVDNVKPVANAAKFVTLANGNKVVEIEFSEEVLESSAETNVNYTFKKTDGTLVTGNGVDGAGHPTGTLVYANKKVQIPVTSLPAGNVTVTLKDVKDVAVPAQNTMDETSLTFSVVDNSAPSVSRAIYTGDQKSLYVYFSKAMDTASITDLNNYMLNTTVLSTVSGATATALADNKGVVITFSTAQTSLLSSSTTLSYGRLKDAQGNYTSNLQNNYGAISADTIGGVTGLTPDIINVKAVSNDTVTFEVKHALSSIDSSRILWNGVAVGHAYYVNQKVDDNTVDGALVTVKLATGATVGDKLYDNATAGTNGFGLDLLAKSGSLNSALVNVNGNGLAADVAIASATDAIAPKVDTATVYTNDGDNDGFLDAVYFSFTETMKASTIALDTFSVNGYTVLDVQPVNLVAGEARFAPVTLDNGTVINAQYKLVLKEQSYADGTNKPTVNLAKAAKDVAGNEIAPTSTGVTPTVGVN